MKKKRPLIEFILLYMGQKSSNRALKSEASQGGSISALQVPGQIKKVYLLWVKLMTTSVDVSLLNHLFTEFLFQVNSGTDKVLIFL